jgi:diguanylate cyclase
VLKRYREPPEKSAELLRLALGLMSKQEAGVHPISYAVWYEYVGGFSAALRTEVDHLTKDGRKLDDETTRRLYATYIAELDESTVARLGDNLTRVVHDVSESTTRAGNEAGAYGEKLSVLGNRLEKQPPAGELPELVREALEDTVQMRSAMSGVHERLSSSRQEIDELRAELRAKIRWRCRNDPWYLELDLDDDA